MQTRRQFLRTAAASLLAVGTARSQGNNRAPNVLVILTDDQRFDTIHALGNRRIVTPNLDWLVQNGTAFTNAYIMGSMSGAVCMPSRAMLMTGRTLFHLDQQGAVIPPEQMTFPEAFRRAGYVTFHTGKWHQDRKAYNRCFSQGADIFFGGMSDHFRVPVRDYDPTGQYSKETIHVEEGRHSSELFSDAAIGFLKGHKGEQPFLMYVAYTAPHDPREAPKQYMDRYDPAGMELPESYMPEHPFDNGEMKIRDEALAPWPRTPEEIRKHQAAYYAMISHLDAQIGRVLQALRETGHADNTIIVFCADNGLAVGRHGLMGKQSLYEHSMHVPLIFCGPGIPKGQTRESFCYLLDIYPTLCEMAGLETPARVEGRTLLPSLQNPAHKGRETLFFAYKDVQRAIRADHMKLIEYSVAGVSTTQLFDVAADPWERRNLVNDARYAGDLRRLQESLVKWRKMLQDESAFWRR